MANVFYRRVVRTKVMVDHAPRLVRRDRLVRAAAGASAVSNPTKGDYPETLFTEVVSQFAKGITDDPAPKPERLVRDRPWNRTTFIVSGRSAREVKQLVAHQLQKVISNIQVRDDGKYFVYLNEIGE